MYRGTTPTLIFNISEGLNLDNILDIWITVKNYSHKKTYKLSNREIEFEPDERKMLVDMSQEDTLAFCVGKVKIQARFLTNENKAYASVIVEKDINEILQDGVIK